MKQVIDKFIEYLRYERNVSPDTIREYRRDMRQVALDAAKPARGVDALSKKALALAPVSSPTPVPAPQNLIDTLQAQGISTASLTTAIADETKQMLPFTQGSTDAKAVLVSLINNALGPGTVSLRTLNKWTGTNSGTLKGFNSIVAESTIKAGTLAGVLVAVLGAPRGQVGPPGAGADRTARGSAFSLSNLPRVRPNTGNSPVIPGLALEAGAQLMPAVPAARGPPPQPARRPRHRPGHVLRGPCPVERSQVCGVQCRVLRCRAAGHVVADPHRDDRVPFGVDQALDDCALDPRGPAVRVCHPVVLFLRDGGPAPGARVERLHPGPGFQFLPAFLRDCDCCTCCFCCLSSL